MDFIGFRPNPGVEGVTRTTSLYQASALSAGLIAGNDGVAGPQQPAMYLVMQQLLSVTDQMHGVWQGIQQEGETGLSGLADQSAFGRSEEYGSPSNEFASYGLPLGPSPGLTAGSGSIDGGYTVATAKLNEGIEALINAPIVVNHGPLALSPSGLSSNP